MRAAKKTVEPSAEERAQALLADLYAFRSKLADHLNERCMELKNSRDGAALPLSVLMASLTANEPCLCKAVAHLIEKDNQNG